MNRFIMAIAVVVLVGATAACVGGSKVAHVQKIRYELANHIPDDPDHQALFVAMAAECFTWGLFNSNADLNPTQRSTLCIRTGAQKQPQQIVNIYNHLAGHFDTLHFMRLVGASCLGEGNGYRRTSGSLPPSNYVPFVEQCIQRGTASWLSSPVL